MPQPGLPVRAGHCHQRVSRPDPKQAPGHRCGTGRNPAWCGQRARTLGLLRHALFVAPKDSYRRRQHQVFGRTGTFNTAWTVDAHTEVFVDRAFCSVNQGRNLGLQLNPDALLGQQTIYMHQMEMTTTIGIGASSHSGFREFHR